jgi:hypothetical protein
MAFSRPLGNRTKIKERLFQAENWKEKAKSLSSPLGCVLFTLAAIISAFTENKVRS